MTPLILISGGIGAGKSVVCRILAAKGYSVYDCDSGAKALMNSDIDLCRNISRELSPFTSVDLLDENSHLIRPALASVVFSNPQALKILNSLVHPAVLLDLKAWRCQQQGLLFVESAIPATSRLRDYVDEEWIVDAPELLRIERVGKRSALSPEQVRERILAQRTEWLTPHLLHHTIINDGRVSLLSQINQLLTPFSN